MSSRLRFRSRSPPTTRPKLQQTKFVDAKAYIFVQMSQNEAKRGGEQWASFNERLVSEGIEMVVYVADPRAFRFLTVEADGNEGMDRSVAEKLADEWRKALALPLPGGGTINSLSNVAFFSTMDVAPVIRELFAKDLHPINLMANISGSAYDVPKVLDFMLRVCFDKVPVVRFDQDNIVSSAGNFQTEQVISVVRRAMKLFATLQEKGDEGSFFAFSSRYDDPAHTAPKSLDWCSRYSTRPNPGLMVKPLLSLYSSHENAVAGLSALGFDELTTRAKALESNYYSTQSDEGAANKKLFETACDDNAMDSFYNELNHYVKRNCDPTNVLANAAISGAGLVLSPAYCHSHAPFLNFGKFDPKAFESATELDQVSHAIHKQATADMIDWGKVTDGKLMPTVMWIDDQITVDYIASKGGNCSKIAEVDSSAFVPKDRGAPGNPLWYTLEVYLQTLISGFIVREVVTGKVAEASIEAAHSCLEKFSALMPPGSIGALFCKHLTDEGVRSALVVAMKEVKFWETRLCPAWKAMCDDAEFVSKMRAIITKRDA